MNKLTLALAILFSSAALIFGDNPPAAPADAAPPAPAPLLKISDADPAAQAAISLDDLKINTTIHGLLAQTSYILTFRNNQGRALEGELEFPLPEAATVSGYGLDVPAGSGNLVDGVPVEKERARQIFEIEAAKRIDPGIVEHSGGNVFRTRIYPIMGNSTRTVRITYVSDLAADDKAATYSIPLDFPHPLKSAAITIDIALDPGSKIKDAAVDGLKDLRFARTDDGKFLRATQTLANVTLTGSLSVKLPAPDPLVALVEKRVRPSALENQKQPAPEHYFLVSTLCNDEVDARMAVPQHFAIFWDTSISRAQADKSAELAFLKALLAKTKNVTLDVYTRQLPAAPQSFAITDGNADGLFAYLDKLTYDGALRIDQFPIRRNVADYTPERDAGQRQYDYDFFLAFTDGLVTLGEEKFSANEVPVYSVCSDTRANHPLLRRLAQQSANGGGLYLNLQTWRAGAAADAVLAPRIVATLTAENNDAAEILPKGSIPAIRGQRITFTGKLLAKEAIVTLTTSVAGVRASSHSQKITVKQSEAVENSAALVPTFWANQKIADLSVSVSKNSDELLKLGKDFNLVTPNSSLMVLESLDQYVRYRVVPPRSQPDLYQKYFERIESEQKQKDREEAENIARTLVLWEGRVKWWETRFDQKVIELLVRARKLREQNKFKETAELAQQALNREPGNTFAKAIFEEANYQLAALEDASRVNTGGAGPNGTTPPAMGLAGGRPNTPATPVQRPSGAGGSLFSDSGGSSTFSPPTFNLSDITKSGTTSGTGGWGGQQGKGASPVHGSPTATITIKAWSPATPYLRAMAAVPPQKAYSVYLEERAKYAQSPAFFLDCGNYLLEKRQTAEGIRVLTNIAQLRLDNAALLRIAAYRLLQVGEFDLAIDLFDKAKRLRPDEPQSWRDLALAYAARGQARLAMVPDRDFNAAGRAPGLSDLHRALELYQHVITGRWDRFEEIELVALMEANALWQRIQNQKSEFKNPLDPRLVKNLDCDIRIVMTWDADQTDIDLHVIEPGGEEAFFEHPRTIIGGLVSKDFTQGYGPEEYCLRRAQAGSYKIKAKFYATNQQSLTGPVTVQATVITNFGRASEKHQSLTLRLAKPHELETIGEINFTPAR